MKRLGNLFVLLGFLITDSQAAGKPNVLFVAIDDLKPLLGCYGDKMVNQPDPAEAPKRFERFDVNKDGILSRDEFINMGVTRP